MDFFKAKISTPLGATCTVTERKFVCGQTFKGPHCPFSVFVLVKKYPYRLLFFNICVVVMKYKTLH